MDNTIQHIPTVAEYNDMLGIKTLHPLVSVIDLSKSKPMRHHKYTYSFYAIFLKGGKSCDLLYGRQRYDYQEGSVICLAPGQVIGVEDNGEVFQPKGWALCFDPEIIRGTPLGRNIREYTFFSYEVNEALQLSEDERSLFLDCLRKIQRELAHSIDHLSKRLIANNIELLLNYCLRFYERQFITREPANRDILVKFEDLLHAYFQSGRPKDEGLPTVKYCASELCLSPNYFGDLVRKETGKSARDYIQLKVTDIAKEKMMEPDKTLSQIAYELGFEYPQHFTRYFKNAVGQTPSEYRTHASAS